MSFNSDQFIFIITILFFNACQAQNSKTEEAEAKAIHTKAQEKRLMGELLQMPIADCHKIDYEAQVGEYIREIFEDSKGNLWFGTLGKGVAKFDPSAEKVSGEILTYFSDEEGLISNQINGIGEDKNGNIWLATTGGVSKLDPSAVGTNKKVFQNFTTEEGLADNVCWSLFVDSNNNVWVGTVKGVCRLNNLSLKDEKFEKFELPKPEIETLSFCLNDLVVQQIIEDRNGNLWFARDGYGICKYKPNPNGTNGTDFTHFTRKDGLSGNSVYSILEDKNGNFWFGSVETVVPSKDNPHVFEYANDSGLTFFDGKTFTKFPEVEELSKRDVYPVYEDKSGNIWVGSKQKGVFKHNPVTQKFVQFEEEQGITYNCIQSILEDKNGLLWFGFSGGLFRFDGMNFVNIRKEGPWP